MRFRGPLLAASRPGGTLRERADLARPARPGPRLPRRRLGLPALPRPEQGPGPGPVPLLPHRAQGAHRRGTRTPRARRVSQVRDLPHRASGPGRRPPMVGTQGHRQLQSPRRRFCARRKACGPRVRPLPQSGTRPRSGGSLPRGRQPCPHVPRPRHRVRLLPRGHTPRSVRQQGVRRVSHHGHLQDLRRVQSRADQIPSDRAPRHGRL